MKSDFYWGNRKRFYKNMPEGTLFAICSGRPIHKTADEEFRFFAYRSFVYLTGIDEPDSILLAWNLNGKVNEVLFIRDMDPTAEIRGGKRITKEKASETSGVEEIAYISQFEKKFHTLARDTHFHGIFLSLESNTRQEVTDQNHVFRRLVGRQYPGLQIRNAFPCISAQRTIKSPEELENIREALDITRKGMIRMMKSARSAKKEIDLLAEFLYVIHTNGNFEPAFNPITSCGKNNFFLHYATPSGLLTDGDLCLTDVGAIVDYCCVDISRVFPRNGVFSQRQKDIYNISLDANVALQDEIKAGMNFSQIDIRYRQLVLPGLKTLGLLKDVTELDRYVWHGCTHHIGFDVHDVGSYQVPIEENMVFTMDTGLYVREWGIGMRIEDDMLVTEQGLELLSLNIPRTIEDIEGVMA